MSTAAECGAILRRPYEGISRIENLDLIPRLTLALLILFAGAYWYIHIPMTVVCICGLVFQPLHRNRWYWLLLTVVMAWGNALNWYDIDNHKYLMTYWCLAIACSLALPDPHEGLATNARLLIGFCFGLATIWKAITPDYLNGSFFHYSLLTDPRFQSVAEIAGGLPPSSASWNRILTGQYHTFDGTIDTAALRGTPALVPLAKFMTWWTILIEGAVAVSFLAPMRSFVHRWRNLFLLAFAVTTYALAHVVGYGWVLMVMGAAQCLVEERRSRAVYVAVFFLIQIYTIPWASIVRLLTGTS